jgi:predicted ATPase
LQVASDLIGQFWDGVWFVELSELVEQAWVSQAVASVLSVPEDPSRPVTDVLQDYVRDRQLLLVLDTCSHAIEEIASLAERLLSVAAHLRLLVTSREILRVPGEVTVVVPPRSVPGMDDLPSIDELMEHDGVRLFVDRARIHQPGFSVTEQNGAFVAQLCRRLDGLPLAIELAAARIRTLPVSDLVRRLDVDLDLLANGSRNAPPRQQTLQATIDWSYNSLSEMERTLFDRLSVFVDPWTLEAAEAVTASGDLEVADVVDLLTALVNKSMVVVENDSEDRAWYRLLGTLREYGRRRLVTSGDEPELQRRRAAYLVSLAERAEPELIGRAKASWLGLLERLHPNLRAALAWSLEIRQIEAGMRLAAALWRFWYLRGSGVEGNSWFEAFIAVKRANQPNVSSDIVAKFYQSAGKLAAMQGEHGRAADLIEAGLRRFRANGDRRGIADLLSIQGMLAQHQGDCHSAI